VNHGAGREREREGERTRDVFEGGRGGIRRVISDLNKLRYVPESRLPAPTIRTKTTRAEPVAPG